MELMMFHLLKIVSKKELKRVKFKIILGPSITNFMQIRSSNIPSEATTNIVDYHDLIHILDDVPSNPTIAPQSKFTLFF
jgi:hypothetical protein